MPHPALSEQPADLLTPSVDALNRACFCLSLDAAALTRALESELGRPGLAALLREHCPHVFAAQPVFVAPAHLARIAEVVKAIEAVVALPAFREPVLAAAPPTARPPYKQPPGVFYGVDFHLDGDRLSLIEINTNAGGAMLNAVLARAQRACCDDMAPLLPSRRNVEAFEAAIVAMFQAEWRAVGRTEPLRTIAIVDEQPQTQYLYPEFLLFAELFERHGLRTVITDPALLQWRDGRLWHEHVAIDLVYNRLTDFYLQAPSHQALRDAWWADAVVLTPHPRAHALYADKRHLTQLSDAQQLHALGVPPALQAVLLQHVPHTEFVTPEQAERLWSQRRTLFFKPVAGFGSRAAYRGDKLTRRVWSEILAGDYVAQALVQPGERPLDDDPNHAPMKFDLRAYVYQGQVQWVAARLYQGQTTNFRTPGGGFAPVYSLGERAAQGD